MVARGVDVADGIVGLEMILEVYAGDERRPAAHNRVKRSIVEHPLLPKLSLS